MEAYIARGDEYAQQGVGGILAIDKMLELQCRNPDLDDGRSPVRAGYGILQPNVRNLTDKKQLLPIGLTSSTANFQRCMLLSAMEPIVRKKDECLPLALILPLRVRTLMCPFPTRIMY